MIRGDSVVNFQRFNFWYSINISSIFSPIGHKLSDKIRGFLKSARPRAQRAHALRRHWLHWRQTSYLVNVIHAIQNRTQVGVGRVQLSKVRNHVGGQHGTVRQNEQVRRLDRYWNVEKCPKTVRLIIQLTLCARLPWFFRILTLTKAELSRSKHFVITEHTHQNWTHSDSASIFLITLSCMNFTRGTDINSYEYWKLNAIN